MIASFLLDILLSNCLQTKLTKKRKVGSLKAKFIRNFIKLLALIFFKGEEEIKKKQRNESKPKSKGLELDEDVFERTARDTTQGG